MAYDPTALALPINQVRLRIGDTDPNDPLLTDDEIEAFLPGGALEEASTIAAAAACCDSLVTRARHLVDIAEGGANARLSQLAPSLEILAKQLWRQAGSSTTAAAIATALTTDPDGNTRGPAFTRTLGEFAGAGNWP